MNVLVSVATRHGSSAEVGRAIADALLRSGLAVDVKEPGKVVDVTPYDGVVVGSAVYMGRWLEPARALVERHADELRDMPVWLFSVGPLGDPPQPVEEPMDMAQLADSIGARERRVFSGKLGDRLGLGERAIIRVVKAPRGDFRDWPAIDEWAGRIALQLAEASARAQPATVR